MIENVTETIETPTGTETLEGTQETTTTETGATEEVTSATNEGFEGGDDVLDTPSLALPPQSADIHEGTVISVSTKTGNDSGNTYGVITLQSKQTGKTEEFNFFPPQAWFEEWPSGKFDPSTLSDVPPPGKKQSARVAYARAVSSTQAEVDNRGQKITRIIGKEGTLQLLRKLAAEQGLTLTGYPKPTSGHDYIALINALVAGQLQVLFVRRPEKNDDPKFDGNLKVKEIKSTTFLSDPNFEKATSKLVKAWEV